MEYLEDSPLAWSKFIECNCCGLVLLGLGLTYRNVAPARRLDDLRGQDLRVAQHLKAQWIVCAKVRASDAAAGIPQNNIRFRDPWKALMLKYDLNVT
jgi:hypothetical protein